MNDEVFTFLRIVNVPMLTFAALGLYVRFSDLWGTSPRGLKVMASGVVLYFLLGAYGSGESYLQQTVVGARTPGGTVCAILVLVGLWMSRHERWFQFDYEQRRKPPTDR